MTILLSKIFHEQKPLKGHWSKGGGKNTKMGLPSGNLGRRDHSRWIRKQGSKQEGRDGQKKREREMGGTGKDWEQCVKQHES